MQTVYDTLNQIWIFIGAGLIISIVLLMVLRRSKVASDASRTYAFGSIAALIVGGSSGYYSIYFVVAITRGNVIGLFGGYALIVLALIQYFFDRRKTAS